MSKTKRSGLYFGGMPTEPDVRKIREAFPTKEMMVGQIITKAQIETILDLSADENRFSTVVSKWRKEIKAATGTIMLQSVPGGFQVMDAKQKIHYSESKMRSSRRAAVRSLNGIACIDDFDAMSEEDKRRALAVQGRAATILAVDQVRNRKMNADNLSKTIEAFSQPRLSVGRGSKGNRGANKVHEAGDQAQQ